MMGIISEDGMIDIDLLREELKNNVIIYMCGNTVDKHCLYFREMGLYNILKMEQGKIDIYKFNTEDERQLLVAVEYCNTSVGKPKKSDLYFSFDNPTLKMIKKGEWDLNIYPHLKGRFIEENIIFQFLVKYNDLWVKGYLYLMKQILYIMDYLRESRPAV